LAPQAPHFLAEQAPHFLALQAPHFLAEQAPHFLALQAPHFLALQVWVLVLQRALQALAAQPDKAAAVTTAAARVRERSRASELMENSNR
jgi:hypothetical protein